jgi:hypothetical protein
VTLAPRHVALERVPALLFELAVTYLADTLRECQLVLIADQQGEATDPDLVQLARGLVPDLEELRDHFRAAAIVVDGADVRVEVELSPGDAGTIANLHLQLVRLRFVDQRGLLVTSDDDVARFLDWVWDEIGAQMVGRAARPYRC